MLNGPFLISGFKFSWLLASPGVYILSRDGRSAHYVGRADKDLGERLRSSAKEGSYTHFWYESCISPTASYRLECRFYHQYKPSDNLIHPSSPSGILLSCEICLLNMALPR
jgi:excinuclease UvrABC nuclease subunit